MINGKSAMKKKLFYSKELPNQVLFGLLTKPLACATCMDRISTAESLIKLLLLVLLSKQVTGLLTVFSLVWSRVHRTLDNVVDTVIEAKHWRRNSAWVWVWPAATQAHHYLLTLDFLGCTFTTELSLNAIESDKVCALENNKSDHISSLKLFLFIVL